MIRVTIDRESARRIAGAIVDYIASRDVRYADREKAMKRAYDELVSALECADIDDDLYT